MERMIITYGGYFEHFMSELDRKTQEKVHYGLLLLKTQDRLATKFVKHIRDGIFELRTMYNSNIYIVCFLSLMEIRLLCYLMASIKRPKKLLIVK